MLYDPKWEADKQLGPISLKSFIAWLETQNPNELYDYCKGRECALGQYLGFLGRRDREVDLGAGSHIADWQITLKNIVAGDFDDRSWTFAAALTRARAALASTP